MDSNRALWKNKASMKLFLKFLKCERIIVIEEFEDYETFLNVLVLEKIIDKTDREKMVTAFVNGMCLMYNESTGSIYCKYDVVLNDNSLSYAFKSADVTAIID